MKVTIAIDSFKGSMTSLEAGAAAAKGVRRVYSDAEIHIRPMADGGEGTTEALVSGMGGESANASVTGPLGEPRQCKYGILHEGKTAVIEMAEAAGIVLVPAEKRNPLYTTTYGVGELIKAAIAKGCRRFIVGIGGSATNDGGAGMLQALGFGLLDKNGRQVPYGAAGLEELETITTDKVLPELSQCTFFVACDVTNPLCGLQGASAVFGPQKGADEAMVERMDRALERFAELAKGIYPDADSKKEGTGAAGGLGFAFLTFLNADLESGVKLVLEETRLKDYVRDCDIVITGEGRLDGQTVMGKAPIGVARIAKEFGKKVIAFSGCVTKDAVLCNEEGIDAFFPILRTVTTLSEAMEGETAQAGLADTVEQAFRLIRSCERII